VAMLFLRGQRTAIFGPTFGEYENVAQLAASPVTYINLPGWVRDHDGHYVQAESDLEDAMQSLRQATPDVVFLCNPNNPTGQLLSPTTVDRLYQVAPGALWIIDEAYMEFVAAPWSATRWCAERKLIVLRSMTKDYALGGLRLGYAVAAPGCISTLQNAQPPWNVNGLAQVAGIASLHEVDWHRASMAQLRQEVAALRDALTAKGFSPLPTEANYFLLPVSNAATVRAALLRSGLLVRDCTSFGLPNFIRIASQRPNENQRLVEALADLIALGMFAGDPPVKSKSL
jgi:histidinol-phosphate aminotransferase